MSGDVSGGVGRDRGRWRRSGPLALTALAVGFAGMWVAGLFAYTSVGLDHDEVSGDRVRTGYYRLRWPGDGSFWVGGGSHDRPLAAGPPERFDPAATWFGRPKRPPPRSVWHRLGFWWAGSAAEDPFLPAGVPAAVRSGWVAVPGWLPALLFGAWPARRLVRECRGLARAAEPGVAPDPRRHAGSGR